MNQFYPSFTWAAVGGREDFQRVNLILTLMSASFAFNPEHKTFADVREHVIASVPLEHSLDGDVLDAEDVEFNGELRGKAGSLVIYAATGAPEASPLLAILDRMFGLPAWLDGLGSVAIVWDNGPLRIGNVSDIK